MSLTEMSFPTFSCAIYQEAKNGALYCGDSFFVGEFDDYFVTAIADGLGSGIEARFASIRAMSLLERRHNLPVTRIAREINQQLRGTRGAVLALVKFFPEERQAEFLGVGNISFTLYPTSGQYIRPISSPGYLDGREVRLRTKRFPYIPGDRFIMHSDGISTGAGWSAAFRRSATPAAGLNSIKRLWKKQNDDITVIVGR